MSNPRYPVYIPSKGRADIALTPRALDQIRVPYRIIVEEQQYHAYAASYPERKLLVLPRSYQEEYDTGDDLGTSVSVGPGAARNFARDHSLSEGYPWHWTMDDNIDCFGRLHQNVRRRSGDGMIFAAMEDFCSRYLNIGMAGPEYTMFLPSREGRKSPFQVNRRIFSCQLTNNATGVRYRSRYNDDLAVAIELLKAGWCTVKFTAFWQSKKGTQRMPGGCTTDLYQDGTLLKSQSIVRQYPDIVKLTRRYGRWHHQADFSRFENMRLIRDPAWTPPEVNPYQNLGIVPNPNFRRPLNPKGLTEIVNVLSDEHAARPAAPWKGNKRPAGNR